MPDLHNRTYLSVNINIWIFPTFLYKTVTINSILYNVIFPGNDSTINFLMKCKCRYLVTPTTLTPSNTHTRTFQGN